MKRLALLILPLLTSTACRGEDLAPNPAATRLLVDEVVALTNDHADALCECAADYGFESLDDCRDYFVYVEPLERTCIDEVVSVDPLAARDFLECTVALDEQRIECLQPLACSDGPRIDACERDYREGLVECPELPIGTLSQLRECMD